MERMKDQKRLANKLTNPDTWDREGERMKFDAIVGNPPYQQNSNDSRNTSRDVPVYQYFVDSAKTVDPHYLSMIIPSRWMATGLGLNEFRQAMLSDRRIRSLCDYPDANDIFPMVEIKGGICYFLWDKDNTTDCIVTTKRNGEVYGPDTRMLDEYDVFVRYYCAVEILRKVLHKEEESIVKILSVDKEFGWTSNYTGFSEEETERSVPLYYNRKGQRLVGWIEREKVTKSPELIDKWKVMIPEAGSDGGKRIPDPVLGSCFVAPSPSVCTQTYLFFYVDDEQEANNIATYVQTKFFRFLVSLRKITQHAPRAAYSWVPMQDFSKSWTDAELYEKYDLTQDEIAFVERMIKPMG